MSEIPPKHTMHYLEMSQPTYAVHGKEKSRPWVAKELPIEFVNRFIAVFKKHDPVVADTMVESGTASDQALTFYNTLKEHMNASDFAGLTADAFENIVASGLVLVEMERAGIKILSMETQDDVLRALHSRPFKRYLKAEARKARARLKELDKRRRTREARMKELAAKKQTINNTRDRVRETLSGLDESITEKELVIAEMKAEKTDLTQNWPPRELVDNLRKAQEELERHTANPG